MSDARVLPEQRDKQPRRQGRAALVGGLAVMVIGIAAAVSYPMVREELERARMGAATRAAKNQPAAAPAPRVTVPEDPSERCELQMFRDQPGGETIVVLTQPGKMTEFRPNYYASHSRLTRELVRQAVLMAAREGMNLPVRDAVIGDPSPAGQPAEVIEVDAQSHGHEVYLIVCRGAGEKREGPAGEEAPGWREQSRQLPDDCRSSRAPHRGWVTGRPRQDRNGGQTGSEARGRSPPRRRRRAARPDGVRGAVRGPAACCTRHSGPTGRRPAGSRRCRAPTPISAC